jgi:hypothetical protein
MEKSIAEVQQRALQKQPGGISSRTEIEMPIKLFIMKIKKNIKHLFVTAMAAFVFPNVLTGEEHHKLELPEALAKLTDEALEIKKIAMEYPGMHHNELIIGEGLRVGISGKRFQEIIERISNFPMPDDLIKSAEDFQYKNISAKIVIWALDKKNRKDEYERFAKYYVNKPNDNEIIEYFSRPLLKQRADPFAEPREPASYIPRPGTWTPNPVDEEDQKEEFRLILEYYYFAPPIREAFSNDLVRSHLSQALLNLGDVHKSLVVWQSDLSISLQVPIEKLEKNRGAAWNVYISVWPLVNMETKEAFKVLAEHWGNKRARKSIEWQLLRSWWPMNPQPLDESRYEEAKQHYDAWMSLARETWETPNEKSFAAWLLEQPAPQISPI